MTYKPLVYLLVVFALIGISRQQDLKHEDEKENQKKSLQSLLQNMLADEESYAVEEGEDDDLKGLEQAEEDNVQVSQDDGGAEENALASQDDGVDATAQYSYWYYRRMMYRYRNYYRRYVHYYNNQVKQTQKYKHLYSVYYRSSHYCMHHMTKSG